MKHRLWRRGFDLGSVDSKDFQAHDAVSNWKLGEPILCPALGADYLASIATEIQQSNDLYQAVLDEQDAGQLLQATPYLERIQKRFEYLGSTTNLADEQEIDTLVFDAIGAGHQQLSAQDLWMKISWLSFHEEDGSLRFRFSFGADNIEDVAADPHRQTAAAALCDAVFPESAVITANPGLQAFLNQVESETCPRFVERIVYFNAPNGGAYLHHDTERGHAGVVFAQLTGATFWLALSKARLIQAITDFCRACIDTAWPATIDKPSQRVLQSLLSGPGELALALDSLQHSELIQLINETQEFVQFLIARGHGRLLQAGDILLLPQNADELCCWHSVFSIGERAGQGLSFAVRLDSG